MCVQRLSGVVTSVSKNKFDFFKIIILDEDYIYIYLVINILSNIDFRWVRNFWFLEKIFYAFILVEIFIKF